MSAQIYGKIRGREGTVVQILDAMLSQAKAYRSAEHEHRWERCIYDRRSQHHPKVKFEPGRSRRFVPLASVYGDTLVAADLRGLMPTPNYIAAKATNEEGQEFESQMTQEMLFVLDQGRFADALEDSEALFLTHGFAPVLVIDDPDLDVPRSEVLDPMTVWADHAPLAGTTPDRVWRAMERQTTLPDLLAEQEASGGKKYSPKQLEKLADKVRGTKGRQREEELTITSWWGDLYLPDPKGGPSTVFGRTFAVWSEDTLLACRAIDTPGGRPELHLIRAKNNVFRDLYGEPRLWAGVGVQSAANGVLNQGIDYASTLIKRTPWLRAGSQPALHGITWGEPIISERREDVDLALGQAGSGAGLDALFRLLPLFEMSYARAVGAPMTHSTEQQPRTAREVGIQAQVVETRQESRTGFIGRQWELVIEQMQQLRARRFLELAQRAIGGDQAAVDELPGTVARRSQGMSEDARGWGDVTPDAWVQQYKISMIGTGMIAEKAERLAGYQVILDTWDKLSADDPVMRARLKRGMLFKHAVRDNLGMDPDDLLWPEDEVQSLIETITAQVQMQMATQMQAAMGAPGAGGPPAAGGPPNG